MLLCGINCIYQDVTQGVIPSPLLYFVDSFSGLAVKVKMPQFAESLQKLKRYCVPLWRYTA